MIKHTIVTAIKKIAFPFGEPYLFGGKSLRFKPGTRPIRRSYINSSNYIDRNDVLQINWLENNFQPDNILWDIGSHHGHYSIFAASRVAGNNQVFSFEPDGDARKVQNSNISLNKLDSKITVMPIAISDKNGHIPFTVNHGAANSHVIKGDKVTGKLVETRTLESLHSSLPLPTLVKIDTEGAEIDILRQANSLLQDKRVRFICELHPFAWDYFGVAFAELKEIVNKYKRTFTLLDPDKKLSDLPYYGAVIF